jgi:hypothetical protein
VLSAKQAVDLTAELVDVRGGEQPRLDRVHRYLSDEQPIPWLPAGAPNEVRQLAAMARVNVLKFVVSTQAQSLFVSGYRSMRGDEEPVWDVWQRNGMDRRQVGVHRAALGYGAAYMTVLPGAPVPVMRGVSPRNLTAVYGDDDLWPTYALEKRRTAAGELWRLFDDTHTYWLGSDRHGGPLQFISSEEHGLGVVPVVRFVPEDDLDGAIIGEVEPLIALQDQINITTFGLLVAQHYGAFRQRWIIGWTAESENQLLRASAAKTWTFEDHPDEVRVGEFSQTDLAGYIDSREASLRHLATVSQTPVHELLGTLANLSAEALVAARHSADRKTGEREITFGESHEQALEFAGLLIGAAPDPAAQVRWKDTTARSLAQVADALGKISTQLGVPPEALWEMIPGVDRQDVTRWSEMRAETDAFAGLTAVLERQSR